MRNQWLVCLLLGGLVYGQAASPVPPPHSQPAAAPKGEPNAAADEKATETKVSPSDPVITVKGACTDAAKKGETCETVVTREQFEKLAEALQPNMAPPIKLRLATAYSRLIGMSKEAEKRGLDKQPKFEANMGFARMQILSQQLTSSLQEESQKISDADIERYYKDKIDTYRKQPCSGFLSRVQNRRLRRPRWQQLSGRIKQPNRRRPKHAKRREKLP